MSAAPKMAAKVLNGKLCASDLRKNLAATVATMGGVKPGLAIVQVSVLLLCFLLNTSVIVIRKTYKM